MTDKMLHDAVLRELDWEPRVNAAHIGVAVSNSAITLTGEVATFTARNEAVKAAERALRWNNEVPVSVDAEIKNGFVTLTGKAEWQFQRAAAIRAVRDLHGVTGVANEVPVVNPNPRPADVEQRIRRAFERHARLDARQVEVPITDGTAHLHGHVHSIFEKHAAGVVPGVSHVDDRIVVMP